jgi:transcriptional regulator with XRE-family HTH domain
VAEKDQILVKLGRNLRKAREKRGWSQEEFAFRCGVHRTYVGSVERGEYNVTILTLRKFTKALGISLRDAIRGVS